MTTINCSLNCIYQADGMCNLENTTMQSISSNPECIYYQEREAKVSSLEV
jgi:hypothetical protein